MHRLDEMIGNLNIKRGDKMKAIEVYNFSPYIQELIKHTNELLNPNKIVFFDDPKLPVQAQADHDNFFIYIKSNDYDDYTLSHELLHFHARIKKLPILVKVFEMDMAGLIGTELQGYLEHKWILAEQLRLGISIDEFNLYKDIESTIGRDGASLQSNIKRICIINNLILIHPQVFKSYETFFSHNNPMSLQYSKRIMSHFPHKEIFTPDEARRLVIKGLNEWKKIFSENSIDSHPLSLLIIVIPVFSQAQLRRAANAVLSLIPNAVGGKTHVLQTAHDGQCCLAFEADEYNVQLITDYLNKMTLKEFINNIIPFHHYVR